MSKVLGLADFLKNTTNNVHSKHRSNATKCLRDNLDIKHCQSMHPDIGVEYFPVEAV